MATSSAQWIADAPPAADLTQAIADAVFKTIKPYLTPVGRKNFRAEIAQAQSAQDVLDIFGAWIMTREFTRIPNVGDRLTRAAQAFADRAPGETPKELFARLAT